ncbi:olfactory receptor 6C1-like [Salarias fasciatus]|uniref:Olfactory receptor 6C1-like n=1 Tax=Salarias fasciatus TaxID=181472 RepID=A0A672IXK9_SALFA|nr:olfactory receptor 6C1-like [Salarias fasciatus]
MIDNVTAVRAFTLLGINETMNYRATVFAMTLLYYSVILIVNISLVTIIIFDENLHEPMYILLASFCVNGLYGASGFYPRFLVDLLSSTQDISYEGCLLQAFVMYSFASCELSILAVMAYDRYLAICRPLHYRSLMTKRRLRHLISFSWLTPFCIFSISIILTSRLKLCESQIKRLFCINWLIVQLACADADMLANNIVSYATIIIYLLHGFFIIWTYMHLIRTCVKSKEDRVKFMQTCVPHVISLLLFLVVMLFDLMYMRFGSRDLHPSTKNFMGMVFLIIPPILNPLIYGFKLGKIRTRILGLIFLKEEIGLRLY